MILNKMYVLGATQWKSLGVEMLSYKYNLSLEKKIGDNWFSSFQIYKPHTNVY